MDRRNQIINILNECNLIHSNDLRVQLLAHEKEKGYNTEMCIKSMKRILQALKQSNTLNIYEILLQFDDNIRLYRYVAHPQITIDHPLIQREIIKLKNLFFLNNEERKIRKKSASAREKSKSQLPNVKKKSLQDAFHKLNKTSKAAVHKPPKFLISRYLHEFLFYIVVELSEYQAPKEITVDLLFEWQRSEPSLSVMEYLDQISKQHTELFAYTEDISWRTFIPPLPKYSDKPAGWVFFIDVIDRMPLSIFNKIFRVEKEASPHLAEYITHPIRQHYLMRQLPPELQVQISRLQLHKVYLNILKLLNHMGLIQVI